MAKALDDVAALKDDDRFSAVERKLSGGGRALPNISPVETRAPAKERRNKSMSLPLYVWDQLRDEAYRKREPQNAVILRGLKAIGLDVAEDDLIDPRKLRHQS